MKYWDNYISHDFKLVGKKKKVDNTIYTFDIETTSYIVLDDKIYNASKYDELNEKDKKRCIKKVCMYIWMLSVNENVYFGRTWEELKYFLERLESNCEEKKIIFVHNLAYEFQFLKSVFYFTDVFARKSHKVMKCSFEDYNIELRCSYMMSNCGLKNLTELYNLPVEKKVGDLDYDKIRTPATKMTKKELGYCEYDCLVVYYYILEELKTYERVDKISLTSTGHVRRELKDLIDKDYAYKNKVRKSINTDPHVYNLLIEAFAGGFTHANWIYADEIIENVDSYDFTSSYPYVMVTHKYPSTEFKKCTIKSEKEMIKRFAYILVVKFKNIKSKYFNNYISMSKCRNIKKR